MKEQMKRTVYEAPETRLFRIELEGNFCASADVENTGGDSKVGISNQEINTGFEDVTFEGSWE